MLDDDSFAPRAPSRWPRLAWRVAVGVVAAIWLALVLAWAALAGWILPQAQAWRPELERWATRALGVPVAIGSIEVRSLGWVPSVELRDVVLLDAARRPALRLPRVAAAVSARSLLAAELRFEQVLIDGAALEIRRDARGRLFVGGIDAEGALGADGGAGADWFFAQHEFAIRGGTLRWIDEARGAPPLALQQVDLVVRNGLRRHEIRLDATPPAAWGERFTLRGRFSSSLLARAGDWTRWSGTAYAALPRADVAELRQYVELPFALEAGDGALRAWLDVQRGEPSAATLDLALREVRAQLGRELEPLELQRIEGRVVARHAATQSSFAARRLGFVTGDGVEWPRSDLDIELRRDTDGGIAGGAFKAERLDLAVMAGIGERLPVGRPVRALLADLAPRGLARDLSGQWTGPPDAPARYKLQGRFEGLSLTAKAESQPDSVGRPGLAGAAVELLADERGGQARLAIEGGSLTFPGVFEQAEVPVQALRAALQWRIEPVAGAAPRLQLDVNDVVFANDDAQGELRATWTTGPGDGVGPGARLPGVLDMTGKLANGRAVAVARYLPLGVADTARRYVERAVRRGRVTAATFKVRGDLWGFPFHHLRDGEFRIAGRVEDVELAYVPPAAADAAPAWPPFEGIAGELVFDRASMRIRDATARLWGLRLAGVNGGIADLQRATLDIEGRAAGPLADLLRYVGATPVAAWTGGALGQASGSGPAELRLALSLPLHGIERAKVRGSVALAGNDLRLTPDTPLLGAARGRIDFTREGIRLLETTARVLGGETVLEGGTRPDGSLRFTASGTAVAEALRAEGELGWFARLGESMRGKTPYRLELGFVHGHPDFVLTSSLRGMGLDLPAPLAKPADSAWPLRLATRVAADGRSDEVSFALEGAGVQARFERALGEGAPKVLRGALGTPTLPPAPEAGVAAVVEVGALDLDAWRRLGQRLFDGADAAAEVAGGFAPETLALRAASLTLGSRKLSGLVAGISRQDTTWRATLDADQAVGFVELREAQGPQPGRVYARLARLALPAAEADSVSSLLEEASDNVPALDIVVDDFDLRGKRLGRVEVQARHRQVGDGRAAAREWQLDRFTIANPHAQLAASGRWAVGGAQPRRMAMDFKLDLADSGALLERLGIEQAIRGGKGTMQGRVAWTGSPLSLHLPSLDGRIRVDVDRGQFLKAGAGAGRLLGVLSLQSLPRRLALDFRDVFQEGFAFDSIGGDVTIGAGIASTNNLRMRGVQAVVWMEGRADIERETQDLRVIVVPEINAGTASLAYAAINPAVGLGTFVAQLLLRKPLIAAGTREFHVHGNWADPQVDRIERKPGEAPPGDGDDERAAATSAPPPR